MIPVVSSQLLLLAIVYALLAFLLLEVAMDWNGLKGAAFTVLGSSALSVIGFWVVILSLQQIRICEPIYWKAYSPLGKGFNLNFEHAEPQSKA